MSFHQQTASRSSHFPEGILVQQVVAVTMSLGYVGRLCVRAVQAAVRAEPKQHPAAPPKPSTAAAAAAGHHHHLQPAASARRASGELAAGPAARTTTAGAEEETMAAMRRRRAEKDENLMNLVFWGPN